MDKFLLAVFILSMSVYRTEGCGANNIQCITRNTYQICVVVGTKVVLADPLKTCPTGTACFESTAPYACVDEVLVGPPETCTEVAKYPAPACNQYWECVPILWWFELQLQTCGANQSYNTTSQECVPNSTCIIV